MISNELMVLTSRQMILLVIASDVTASTSGQERTVIPHVIKDANGAYRMTQTSVYSALEDNLRRTVTPAGKTGLNQWPAMLSAL